MARMPYRSLLIRWAKKREKILSYTIEDREELLGTHLWSPQTTNDIKTYVEILEEEIERRSLCILKDSVIRKMVP